MVWISCWYVIRISHICELASYHKPFVSHFKIGMRNDTRVTKKLWIFGFRSQAPIEKAACKFVKRPAVFIFMIKLIVSIVIQCNCSIWWDILHSTLMVLFSAWCVSVNQPLLPSVASYVHLRPIILLIYYDERLKGWLAYHCMTPWLIQRWWTLLTNMCCGTISICTFLGRLVWLLWSCEGANHTILMWASK